MTYEVSAGQISSGIVLSGDSMYVYNGGTANSTTVDDYGQMYVSSWGTANNTTIDGGWMNISSGGTANGIILKSGSLYVYSGGKLTGAIVCYGVHNSEDAYIEIEEGSIIDFDISGRTGSSPALINDFSTLSLYGTPDYTITVCASQNGGIYTLADGARSFNNFRGMFSIGTADECFGSLAVNGAALTYGSYTYILTVENDSLLLDVRNGTPEYPYVVSGLRLTGSYDVSSGWMASATEVNSGGLMTVRDGGLAEQVKTHDGGRLYVSGGLARQTEVYDGGREVVYSSGRVEGAAVGSNGVLLLEEFGNVSGLTVAAGGVAYVMDLGEAENIDVQAGGSLWVGMAGYAENITVDGAVYVATGGEVKNVTISGDGTLYLYGGAIMDGEINVSGTVVLDDVVQNLGSLNFMVGGQGNQFSDAAMLNDYSLLNGKNLSVTVDTAGYDQGSYVISEGAAGYSESMTVYGTGGETIGLLAAGGNCEDENYRYTLNEEDNRLVFSFAAVVINPDEELPEVVSVTADITGPTNQNVTVTAVFSGNTTSSKYSLDNANWQPYTGGVVMTDNGTVWFLAENTAGHSDAVSYAVTNIDKVPPAKPTANADITTPINQNVTVTAVFSDDTAVREYSLDGQNFLAYENGVTMTDNGTVYFRGIDAAGNISDVTSYTVTNIDKIPPAKPTANADITAPTNQNVTVSAVFSDDTAVREYSLDGQNFLAYDNGVAMADNGTVYFRGIDAAGNISDVTSYTVTNIDKIPPAKPTANADITEATQQNVTVSAVFSEDSVQKQYSFNNANWNPYTSGIVFNENGTVYFRGIDNAGNISEVTSYTVGNIQPGRYEITGDQNSSQVVNLSASGKYMLTGSFGDITGSVTIFNGGKKAGTGSIKDGELTFNKGKSILLDSDLETVIQVTIKKGTDTAYDLQLNAESVFPAYDPAGSDRGSALALGTVTAPGQQLVSDGWVGFGDELDYYVFSLDHAANLSLDYTASDAVKFTLYDTAGKSMLSSSVKGSGSGTTKTKLLTAGNYYLAVQSTKAKKGGDANYSVSVSQNTRFFTKGNTLDDTFETAKDLGAVTERGQLLDTDWVGVGDAIDYKKITLTSAGKLSFRLQASDAAKLMVYQAPGGKAIGTATVKGSGEASTKDIFVSAGTYYLAVQSTKAKKDGYADYSVALNESSRFFPAGDPNNNTWQAASGQTAKLAGEEITGWVGYGDAADFIKFQVAEDGQIKLDLNGATAGALAGKQIKLSCLDANGKTVKLVQNGNSLFSKTDVSAGNYYLGVTCANVKKFDTSYSITTGLLAG